MLPTKVFAERESQFDKTRGWPDYLKEVYYRVAYDVAIISSSFNF